MEWRGISPSTSSPRQARDRQDLRYFRRCGEELRGVSKERLAAGRVEIAEQPAVCEFMPPVEVQGHDCGTLTPGRIRWGLVLQNVGI